MLTELYRPVLACLPGFCTIGVEPRFDCGFATLFVDGDGDLKLTSEDDCAALYGLYLLSTFPELAVRYLEEQADIANLGILTEPLVLVDSLVLIEVKLF